MAKGTPCVHGTEETKGIKVHFSISIIPHKALTQIQSHVLTPTPFGTSVPLLLKLLLLI